MKVFISWSGLVSQAVATALRDWLPSVIQSISPYVSSEDIETGTRWSFDIAKELEASEFGIICISPTNANAPWINFEAGALSKAMDRSHVVPFLFRLERSALPQGPLLQFQSRLATQDEVKKLIIDLNRRGGERPLEDSRLESSFDAWWPSLKKRLDAIKDEPAAPAAAPRPPEELLSEVLDAVRVQQQLLSNPEQILPASYLESVVQNASVVRGREIDPQAVRALAEGWDLLIGAIRQEMISESVLRAVRELREPVQYLLHRLGRGRTSRYIADQLVNLPELEAGDSE